MARRAALGALVVAALGSAALAAAGASTRSLTPVAHVGRSALVVSGGPIGTHSALPAGTLPAGVAADSQGNRYITDEASGDVLVLPAQGAPHRLTAHLDEPGALAPLHDGGVVVAAGAAIWRVSAQGVASVVTRALPHPAGLAVAVGGRMFATSADSDAIWEVSPATGAARQVATAAGATAGIALSPDGGTLYVALPGVDALEAFSTGSWRRSLTWLGAHVRQPGSVAVSPAGAVFVGDVVGGAVVELTGTAERAVTAAGSGGVPAGLAAAGSTLSVVEADDAQTLDVAVGPDPAPVVDGALGLRSQVVRSGGAVGATPGALGWWVPGPDGDVRAFGTAHHYPAARSAVRVAAVLGTPDGAGYWLVGPDGSVRAAGDATVYGSMAGRRLLAPIVGGAPTADGHGYYLVGADGGVFAFGDARYLGSLSPDGLGGVVGLAPTGDGRGYWVVERSGKVLPFGDAPAAGAGRGGKVAGSVVGIAAGGRGFWLVGAQGAVRAFGGAAYLGSGSGPTLGLVADAGGYVLISASGQAQAF
jgi:sugar lactone lactonase YvrE